MKHINELISDNEAELYFSLNREYERCLRACYNYETSPSEDLEHKQALLELFEAREILWMFHKENRHLRS